MGAAGGTGKSVPPAQRRPVVLDRALPALTGLRFVAALAVLLFHFGAGLAVRAHFPAPLALLLSHGFMGVSIFFILSGFILSHSYRGRLGSWRELASFAAARFARVYPLYLCALALAWPLARGLSWRSAASVLLMVQSWGSVRSSEGYAWVMQAWTLSVEAVFYLCFPLLFACVRRLRARMAATLAALACAGLVLFALPMMLPGAQGGRNLGDALLDWPLPLLRLVEFGYGMLLYRVVETADARVVLRVASPAATAATLAAVLAILASPLSAQGISAASILFGLLIVQLAVARTRLAALLSSRALLLLGSASYAIYMLQGPVREWVNLIVPSPALAAALNPFVLLAVALAAYRFVEEPARRMLVRELGTRAHFVARAVRYAQRR